MSQNSGGGWGVCGSLCPYMGSIRLGVSWPVGNAAGFLACLPTLCIKRETADAQHTNAHFQVRVKSLGRLTKAWMRFESVGSEVCEVVQQPHLTCVEEPQSHWLVVGHSGSCSTLEQSSFNDFFSMIKDSRLSIVVMCTQ